MKEGTIAIGWIIAIIIAVISGWLIKTSWDFGALILAFILFCCSVAFVGSQIENLEAAKRTPSHPITSFDQKGAMGAGIIIMGIFAFIGYSIG